MYRHKSLDLKHLEIKEKEKKDFKPYIDSATKTVKQRMDLLFYPLRLLSKYLNKLSPTAWFFSIALLLTFAFYIVMKYTSFPITASSTTVTNLLNDWRIKTTAASAFSIGMIYYLFIISVWDKYNKKPQGPMQQT